MAVSTSRRTRRRGESAQARAACLLYLRQGADRSLAKVAAELGYKSKSRVEAWSARYQWRERLHLWTLDPADFEARFTTARRGRHLWPPPVRGRQGPPDSPQAWEAWLLYLAQGESRSYAAVAATLGKSRSLIARWGKQHHWQNRIRNAERRAMEPDEEPWYGPPLDDPLFETPQLVAQADPPETQPPRSTSGRAGRNRLYSEAIASKLRPYLDRSGGDPTPPTARWLPLIRAERMLDISGADKHSVASTIREAVKFLKPIIARSETDEPLWQEEVVEHLEALKDLTRRSRTPLSDREDEAARGLLLSLALVGFQFERGALQQPQALEDMFRLLSPFFNALSHQHPARHGTRPHLRQLAALMPLLSGTVASRQMEKRNPPPSA